MLKQQILKIHELGFMWKTENPFLFCAHHKDAYPKGNKDLGPAAPLIGRSLGNDFQLRDGWRMYHGVRVPGFPEHPHRGFETVTIVLEGFVDHSDSHGASGRYGNGDVQWMTAGSGLQHAEMFPLIHEDKENPLELFQVWLNLPQKDKFADPYFKMLWSEDIPIVETTDDNGNKSSIRLISGDFQGIDSLEPAPNSWAHTPENQVGIRIIQMAPGAVLTLPAMSATLSRNFYFYLGKTLSIQQTEIQVLHSVKLVGDEDIIITNGPEESSMLILEGEPINEPIVKYGPFVMNTEQEIKDAYRDYQATGFGGWPWERRDPVHPTGENRFARYKDGTEENKGPVK